MKKKTPGTVAADACKLLLFAFTWFAPFVYLYFLPFFLRSKWKWYSKAWSWTIQCIWKMKTTKFFLLFSFFSSFFCWKMKHLNGKEMFQCFILFEFVLLFYSPFGSLIHFCHTMCYYALLCVEWVCDMAKKQKKIVIWHHITNDVCIFLFYLRLFFSFLFSVINKNFNSDKSKWIHFFLFLVRIDSIKSHTRNSNINSNWTNQLIHNFLSRMLSPIRFDFWFLLSLPLPITNRIFRKENFWSQQNKNTLVLMNKHLNKYRTHFSEMFCDSVVQKKNNNRKICNANLRLTKRKCLLCIILHEPKRSEIKIMSKRKNLINVLCD